MLRSASSSFRTADFTPKTSAHRWRTTTSTAKLPYGRDEAAIFFNEILPAAPDVAVQIAHLAGAGGYEVPAGDQALQVFVDAIARKDPRAQRLWFDVTTVVLPETPAELAALIARRIRELGVQRVLFGSDAPTKEELRAQGRMGGVSHAAADRGRVPDHRGQRAALHALSADFGASVGPHCDGEVGSADRRAFARPRHAPNTVYPVPHAHASSRIALPRGCRGSAAAATVSAFATRAIEVALVRLAAQYREQTGHEVTIRFDTSPGLARRVAAGESADVLVASASVVDQAIRDGQVVASTSREIGRIALGVATRRGVPPPDVSSVDALVSALRRADAVLYSQGTSGLYIEQMLAKLGLDVSSRERPCRPRAPTRRLAGWRRAGGKRSPSRRSARSRRMSRKASASSARCRPRCRTPQLTRQR